MDGMEYVGYAERVFKICEGTTGKHENMKRVRKLPIRRNTKINSSDQDQDQKRKNKQGDH